ncbi:hypothetical protein C2S52_021888 [Perilla frutescens var. hirtella]|nr:hypothetical protein C2S52_021888 [Perilla frutescens var. hirtella]
MARIEVISSSLVGMAEINATPMSKLELTPWDLPLLLTHPIQRGILFQKPESDQKKKSDIILHLKKSFSRALDMFPPLAGRLATIPTDDNSLLYFVDCNNAGAEFTHADAAAVSVSDILESKHTPGIVSNFFPLNEYFNCEGVSRPLLGVQVTELADGLFIGCAANHAVVDGTSFWHFINSWSELSRGSDTISKPPVFERWFPSSLGNKRVFPLPPLEKSNLQFAPPPLMERVFHFSKESLAELKVKAGGGKISTLQALSAHLWLSTTRSRHSLTKENPSEQEVRVMMAIGARSRIPLPNGYFGNAFSGSSTVTSASELLQGGLGYAALKINHQISEKNSKEALIKSVEDWVNNPIVYRKFPPRKISTVVMITSSPRHNVYANDFGWGKPVAARSGKMEKFDGNMVVYPAAVSGGIDVEVCLAPETLQAMEDDAEFIEAMAL